MKFKHHTKVTMKFKHHTKFTMKFEHHTKFRMSKLLMFDQLTYDPNSINSFYQIIISNSVIA